MRPTSMTTPATVLIALAMLVATACASEPALDDSDPQAGGVARVPSVDAATASPADVEDASAARLARGEWRLDLLVADGEEVTTVQDVPVTLTIDRDRVSGDAGCNTYAADRVQAGTADLEITDIAATRMSCAEDVMAVERAYLDALATVDEVLATDSTLTLTGPGATLTFSRA